MFPHFVIGNHLAIFTMSSADRQTDRQAHTALWVLSSHSYNSGHQTTLYSTHFPFRILFWEVILQELSRPPQPHPEVGSACAHVHTGELVMGEDEEDRRHLVSVPQVETNVHSESPFYSCYHNTISLPIRGGRAAGSAPPSTYRKPSPLYDPG